MDEGSQTERKKWDSRVLADLPCVPIPRAYTAINIPGYVPGVGCTNGFGKDAGTLYIGPDSVREFAYSTRKAARTLTGGIRAEAILQRSSLLRDTVTPKSARSYQGPLGNTELAATMLSLSDKDRRSLESIAPAALKGSSSPGDRASSPLLTARGSLSPVSPKTARSRRAPTARGLSATSSTSFSFHSDASAYSVSSVSVLAVSREQGVGGVRTR